MSNDPKARAPYNFVPLPDNPRTFTASDEHMPDHDVYHDGRHSGYFDIRLTTESPLYIRGPRSIKQQKDEAKNIADFFHHGDPKQPVIPGSSLRGMLRSIVEIITWSKLSRIGDTPTIFYRAVAAKADDPLGEDYKKIFGGINASRVKAGYLTRDGDDWYITPAQQIEGQAFAKVKDTTDIVGEVRGLISLTSADYRVQYHKVCFQAKRGEKSAYVTKVWTPKAGEAHQGVLVCTGNMAESGKKGGKVFTARKQFVLVGLPQGGEKKKIDPLFIRAYRDSLTDFQEEEPFDKKDGFLKEGRPVFYIDNGKNPVQFFGHNPFFRIPAIRDGKPITPKTLLGSAHTDPDTYDMADAMFGHVYSGTRVSQQGKKTQAYAGRVFVEDAFLEAGQSEVLEKEVTLKILSSPKVTTFQHYLEQPDGKDTEKSKLNHYGTPGAKLRGHKLYWRQRGSLANAKENETVGKDDTQHTQVRAVKKGIAFRFRVRFENLSDVELGALAWAIQLPGGEYRHMLGMGKPYGLGVVKLDAELFLIERKARYERLFDENGWYEAQRLEESSQHIEAFFNHMKKYLGHEFMRSHRIQELLFMLEGRAIDGKFSYMAIEPKNEFKDRHVLPHPHEVVEKKLEDETAPKAPKQPDPIAPGSLKQGKVIEVDKRGNVYFTFVEDEDGEFEGEIPADKVGSAKYQEGQTITVRIESEREGSNPRVMICRPATKEERERKK